MAIFRHGVLVENLDTIVIFPLRRSRREDTGKSGRVYSRRDKIVLVENLDKVVGKVQSKQN